MPLLAYIAGPADIYGGLGESYEVTVLLRAEAATPAQANALLRAGVERSRRGVRGASCDAVVTDVTYDNPPDDQGDPPRTPTR
jgi:hypothetical protein